MDNKIKSVDVVVPVGRCSECVYFGENSEVGMWCNAFDETVITNKSEISTTCVFID